jgi:hypothetical protein
MFDGKFQGCRSLSPSFQMTVDVFSQHVTFEIYEVAAFTVANGCVFVSERNHGDFHEASVRTRDGEAYSIDCDGTFGHYVACEVFRNSDRVAPAIAFGIERRYGAGPVHVAEDEVSSEFFASRERLLEIDERALLKRAEGSFFESFNGEISRKGFLVAFDDGKAAAVDGDAGGDERDGSETRRVNRDAAAAFTVGKRCDGAEMLDDARKHGRTPLSR